MKRKNDFLFQIFSKGREILPAGDLDEIYFEKKTCESESPDRKVTFPVRPTYELNGVDFY